MKRWLSRRSWISGSEPYQFGFPQKKHFASLVSLHLGEWPSTAFVSANCCCPIGLWRLAEKLSFLSFQGLFCRCRVQSVEHSKVAIVQHSYRESREWQVPNSQVWDHWQRYVIVATYNSLLQSFQQSIVLSICAWPFLINSYENDPPDLHRGGCKNLRPQLSYFSFFPLKFNPIYYLCLSLQKL